MSIWESLSGLFGALGNLFSSKPPQPTPPPNPPPGGWHPPAPPEPNGVLAELLNAHNAERARRSVPALTINERLNKAAQAHAEWMARNRNMSHSQRPGTPGYTGTSFSDRVKAQGYALRTGGENIAAGQRDVDDVVGDWMASSGHRANILNAAFWNVGFGVARDSLGHLYWCTVFATPMGGFTSRVPRDRRATEVVVHLPPAVVRHPSGQF